MSDEDLLFITAVEMNTNAYARYKKIQERKFFESFTQKHDEEKKPRTPDQINEKILEIISRAGNDMERRVISHKDRNEPELRDVLLASLNSHKDLFSSGESFNKIGKTDILVSSVNETVFIAECKIWRGKKSLKEAIAGYATFELPEKKVIAVVYDEGYIIADVKLSGEHTEYIWISLDSILELDAFPNHFKEFFRRFTAENKEPPELSI